MLDPGLDGSVAFLLSAHIEKNGEVSHLFNSVSVLSCSVENERREKRAKGKVKLFTLFVIRRGQLADTPWWLSV